MSKVDAQRAMKSARHARTSAPATPPPARRAVAAAGTAVVAGRGEAPVVAAPTAPAVPAGAAGLCGHRSMAGRDCRRPAGHPEKSHRYS